MNIFTHTIQMKTSFSVLSDMRKTIQYFHSESLDLLSLLLLLVPIHYLSHTLTTITTNTHTKWWWWWRWRLW